MKSVFLEACLLLWASTGQALADGSTEFDWSSLTPTPELKYHDCYNGFRCARIALPRDWTDKENNKSVVLAVISLPATVATDDPSFGGEAQLPVFVAASDPTSN